MEDQGGAPATDAIAAGGAMKSKSNTSSGDRHGATCAASSALDSRLSLEAAHSSAVDAAMDAMCDEMSEWEGSKWRRYLSTDAIVTDATTLIEGVSICAC